MKAFWDDMFFDMENSKWTNEQFADEAGKAIRDELYNIENAIRKYDLKRAFEIIEELKKYY